MARKYIFEIDKKYRYIILGPIEIDWGTGDNTWRVIVHKECVKHLEVYLGKLTMNVYFTSTWIHTDWSK